MKKSEFIKMALNDFSNTLFVNEEQVKVAVELFEKLGMGPTNIPQKTIFTFYNDTLATWFALKFQ